ncbi:O-antigen ligase family protein [Caulobacter sp. NIBR2454]|uniref:O-antigen ligase family protein n=1 Tax=Caulobacter sp. NIBR2454 TaxID=3015996 RepID=UPI0022B72B19|nr:O-antigen ligase family protein [Caulobacter sp. NIBR2454]
MSEASTIDQLRQAWAQRPSGTLIALASVLLLTTSNWLFGAQRIEVALLQAVVSGLLLAFMLIDRPLREDFVRIGKLPWVGVFFALVVAAAAWSLTPWVPGGPHPVWSYVGQRGFVSIDPSATFVEIVKLLGFACLFMVGATLGASDKRARLSLNATVVGGALFGAWAFTAFVSGDPAAQTFRRLSGHFLSPNTAATLFGALAALGLAMALRAYRETPRARRLSAVTLPVCATFLFLTALIATASRAGMAATLAGLVFIAATELGLRRRFSARTLTTAFGCVAILAAMVVLAGDRLVSRYADMAEAAEIRGVLFRVHWDAFLASPLNGYGLGAFDALNRQHLNAQNFSAIWTANSVHNVYIQWLEEAGLAGAIPMFMCIGVIVVLTLVGAFRRERMRGWLYALIAVDLIILLHSWTDFALQASSVAGLWALLLGLQFSLAQSSRGRGRAVAGASSRIAAAALTGVGCLVGGAMALVALQAGALRLGSINLLQLSIGHDRAAERALEAGRLDDADAASRRALAIAPYDTPAWLRMAYIDRARRGGLSAEGVEWFERSYDLAALDPDVALWRIRFGLENWTRLTPEARAAVQEEADVLLKDSAHRPYITEDLRSISTPTGQMVAAFWLNQIAVKQH